VAYIHPSDILGSKCNIQTTCDTNFNIYVVYQRLRFIDVVVIRDAGVLMLYGVLLVTNDGVLNNPA
jgi:hypothetical protein